MNNMYIVNTPFHLLTSYIIANSYDLQSSKHLVLLNPKAFHSWNKSTCLSMMADDPAVWNRISVFKRDWLKERRKTHSLQAILKEIKSQLLSAGPIDTVYLGSDKILTNQLLLDIAEKNSYIRFDEGVGSYVYKDRRTVSKLGEWSLVQLIRFLGGLNSGLEYNYGSLGAGLPARADYMYKPELLQRPSPNPLRIASEDIRKALDNITPSMQKYDQLEIGPLVVYLGNIDVEHKKRSLEQEVELIEKISNCAQSNGLRFLYKPHHGESRDKLLEYARRLHTLEIFDSYEPLELLLHRYSNIRCLISVVSSGMLYSDLFARQDITRISIMKMIGTGQYDYMEPLLAKSGVLFPLNMSELQCTLKLQCPF